MPLASKIAKAQATLADAGVASPLVDAELIAAHILGVDRLSLRFADDFSPSQQQLFDAALHRRASREPLQHILGTAPFGPLDLRVGPGVFIPRPETEILADWASTFAFAELLRRAKAHSAQQNVTPYRIVDLCSGSGAIACFVFDALATKIASLPAVLAQQLPPVEIVAVELSPEALTYTQANAEQVRAQHQDSAQQDSAQQDTAQQDTVQLTVLQADATDLELLPTAFGITAGEQGTVEPFLDLFLSNPPYVPESSWVDEETKQDPHMAVFGGDDGMSLMPALFQQANRYLRAGGALMIEHDDTTGEAMRTLAAQYPRLSEIETVQDYTQRDRFLRALVRV